MAQQPTDEEYAAKYLRQGVAARVRRLRVLIDNIEQEAERSIGLAERGKTPYSRTAAKFARMLTNGIDNAEVHNLIVLASDADIAHAKGE